MEEDRIPVAPCTSSLQVEPETPRSYIRGFHWRQFECPPSAPPAQHVAIGSLLGRGASRVTGQWQYFRGTSLGCACSRPRRDIHPSLYLSTLAGWQSSPVSPIRPYHRLRGANRATPSLCRRKTLTVQAVRTACWLLVLPSLRWRLQRAEVPPFPPSLFFLSLVSVDTSSRSLPGLAILSLSLFSFSSIH